MAAEPELLDSEEGRMSPNVSYEHTDVNARRIALIAVGVLTISLLSAAFVAIPFFALKSRRAEVSPRRSPQDSKGWAEPPHPRLQASPELDLQGYTAGYDRALSRYAWLDKSHEIAIIPLDRAMQIASQRGVPRFPADSSIPLSQPRQATPLTGFQGKDVAPPQ